MKAKKSNTAGIILGIIILALVVALGTRYYVLTRECAGCDVGEIASQLTISNELITMIQYDLGENSEVLIETINQNDHFFEVTFTVDGREYTSFFTLDGKQLIPSMINLAEYKQQKEAEKQAAEMTPERMEIMEEFGDCLASKNLTLYYRTTCGWCQKEIQELGPAFDKVDSVECTENPEICAEKEVAGVPLWILDGVKHAGYKEMIELASLTGCELRAE